MRKKSSMPFDYTAIRTLDALLTEKGIPHECIEPNEFSRNMGIKIPNYAVCVQNKEKNISVVIGPGTYGGMEGLLEMWIRPCEGNPVGYLTADKCLEMILEEFGG